MGNPISLKRRILLIVSSTVIIVCVLMCLISGYRFQESTRRPDPDSEKMLLHYLSDREHSELLQKVANVQGKELGFGQGVYLRFESERETIIDLLEDPANSRLMHYPYVPISCQEFYEACADWADTEYVWWKPKDVVSPECYVTKECEYLLFGQEDQTVYYYFLPDFLGKRYYCVNANGERETVRR